MSTISFAGLTGIANIIRDMIYMDGGQIWLQQYAILLHYMDIDDGYKSRADYSSQNV